MANTNPAQLKDLIYNSLLDLATDEGINASGKDEIYGCIFGRDSALTILKILKACQKQPDPKLLAICKQALLTLVSLQGKEVNLESGEEPGKFIHEFRKDKFDHLVKPPKPWYIYPDGYLRNYDSLDSTPLNLIAIYKYYQLTQDKQFLISVLPSVEMGLNWIISFGDKDKDLLVDYTLPIDRAHGGLSVHSWTDSSEALKQADGSFPDYPIAPVEVQGYTWLALKLWGRYYQDYSPDFSRKLLNQAKKMKQTFNELFVFKDQWYYFLGQAIDGKKQLIKTITANPLICLWAADLDQEKPESIIAELFIPSLVERAFQQDLFDPNAGIRTMSTLSPTFNPNQNSYHNGSFWPILNGLIHEGLINFGYLKQAQALKEASLKPIQHFQTPIELYLTDPNGGYLEYRSRSGNPGCRTQAWSAASIWDFLT